MEANSELLNAYHHDLMRLYTDPKGEAYEQVVDLAISKSEYFVLKVRSANSWLTGQATARVRKVEEFEDFKPWNVYD